MDNFINILKSIAPLSEESINKIVQISTIQTHKKNDYVLKQGAICNGFYFISKGLVRIFYYKNEKEISEWFAFENNLCFSILSYFNNVPSSLIIQCIEDSEVITISREGLNRLRTIDFEIANFAYTLISGSLIISQERMASIQFETALQRYENLLKVHPTLLRRVPLHYIASYLGVSAETLSRIRTQIH